MTACLDVYEKFYRAASMAVARPPLYWDRVHRTVVCAYCHRPSSEGHDSHCEFKLLKEAVDAFTNSDASK